MIIYDGPVFRIRCLGREVRGNLTLTDERARAIAARLLGRNEDEAILVPRDALRAVGVKTSSELQLQVRDGVIVLRPRTVTLPEHGSEVCS